MLTRATDASRPVLSAAHADLDPVLAAGEARRWPAVRETIVAGLHATATPDREDRLFPGDPAQFSIDGLGIGVGAAGVLWALSVAADDRRPQYTEWLSRRVSARVSAASLLRPGLLDGAAGTAVVLDHLGCAAEADRLLERTVDLLPSVRDVSYGSGLAGIGLALLHLSRRRHGTAAATEAAAIGTRLAAAVDDPRPQGVDVRRLPGRGAAGGGAATSGGSGAGSNAGLIKGWSGVALFLLRLCQSGLATGPAGRFSTAVAALHRDLDRCILAADGTVQVDGGFRTLPYLEIGSAGIVVAATALLRHGNDDRLRAALPGLVAACCPRFVIEPQLFNGRAGLMGALASVRRADPTRPDNGTGPLDPATADAADQALTCHAGRFGWYGLQYQDGTVFPGEGLQRVSADLATGGAGVLLGLSAACSGTPLLPLLDELP